MGKKKYKKMETDELRSEMISLCAWYEDAIKDVKEKSALLDDLIKETRLLLNEMRQEE